MELILEKIKEYLSQYAYSTLVSCSCIDKDGTTLYRLNPVASQCETCQAVQFIPNLTEYCSKAHLYGAYQAERFGGTYVFFCPIGLVHWASPIIINGSFHGALLGGPVHMVEPDQLLIDEIVHKFGVLSEDISKLKNFINGISVIEPKRVNYLSEMLFLVAAHLSDREYLYLQEQKREDAQETDYSKYMRYLKTMGGEDIAKQCYPIEKEKQLMSAIALYDMPTAKQALSEIMAHVILNYGGDFNLFKARILELIILLSRAAMEGGADVEQIMGMNFSYLNQINTFSHIQELIDWMMKILDRFMDCVFNLKEVKHMDSLYKALDFIKRNYMNKITLEEVARQVHFSAPYFSSLFKSEMNCNFNKYLSKVRVEKSKGLLFNPQLTHAEIADLVGFHDQSHFSKHFKEITGMTPGEFRRSRGLKRPPASGDVV